MLGQHKRVFNLTPYQDEWIDLFHQESARILTAIGDKALQIEHIGSTSIPGMAAKPVIDIMVAIERLDHSSDIILPLDAIGYIYHPVDTVPGRMFFTRERLPDIRTHNLNLALKSSEFWKDQLLFRDYLREHKQEAAEYIQLKKHFTEYYAQKGHLDREWKTKFVTRILRSAKQEKASDLSAR